MNNITKYLEKYHNDRWRVDVNTDSNGKNLIPLYFNHKLNFYHTQSLNLGSLSLKANNLLNIICCQSNKIIDSRSEISLYKRTMESFHNIICHIGVGGFYRSHQAFYTHKLLMSPPKVVDGGNGHRWAYVGIGLMAWDNKIKNVMTQQDCLFTVTTRSIESTQNTVVGSMIDFIHVPSQDSDQIAVERLAHPTTKIVSLTITEKGYCLSVDGKLDLNNELIKHDLENSEERTYSAVGLIVKALRIRRLRGIGAFTVLSCDNLPGNGYLTKTMVIGFMNALCTRHGSGQVNDNQSLRKWIINNVKFPNTMVDRITPATKSLEDNDEFSDNIRKFVKEKYCIEDQWPVIAESYNQWIIEDDFVNGNRPQWDLISDANILFVKDVHPYEIMKMRLLNGGHSALSYVSYLMGYRFLDEAMEDVQVQSLLKAFFKEQVSTLLPISGVDFTVYQNDLIKRFSNPFIKDAVLRIAEDGSNKILATMRDSALENIDNGRSVKVFCLVIATWIRYLCAFDESGKDIPIKDTSPAKVNMMTQKARSIFMVEDITFPKISIDFSSSQDKIEDFLRVILGNEIADCKIIVDDINYFISKLCVSDIKSVLKDES